MKNINMSKVILVSLAFVLVGAFQNCGLTFNAKSGFGLAKANGNGTGYDGKAYASYGRCDGQDEVGLKSLVLATEDGTLTEVRKDCIDLAEPVSVDVDNLKPSIDDDSVFVYGNRVFDEVRETIEEAKLTRVICWDEYKDVTMESAVFYAPGDLAPGKISTLSGYVKDTGGSDTGVMSPVVERPTKTDGSLFTCEQNSYVYALDYRSSGNSTMSYYDSSKSDGIGIQRRAPSKIGCFSQHRPKSMITRGDL